MKRKPERYAGEREYSRVYEKKRRRRHPLYSVWCGMKGRCFNPKNPWFSRYGARGITVCERWAKSFAAFLEDMGPRPVGHTLDRIDNNGNYEPGNCRWASAGEQSRNRITSRLITIDGETRTATEWAWVANINPETIFQRIRLGVTGGALLQPSRQMRAYAHDHSGCVPAAKYRELERVLGDLREERGDVWRERCEKALAYFAERRHAASAWDMANILEGESPFAPRTDADTPPER